MLYIYTETDIYISQMYTHTQALHIYTSRQCYCYIFLYTEKCVVLRGTHRDRCITPKYTERKQPIEQAYTPLLLQNTHNIPLHSYPVRHYNSIYTHKYVKT